MRIAMLAWESLHSIAVGGIAVHVTGLARALQRKGHEVHVITRMRAENDSQKEDFDGVQYHRVPFKISGDLLQDSQNMCDAFARFVKNYENMRTQYFEVIHSHDWITSNTMVLLKDNSKKRSVFTMHSTEYGRCGNTFFEGRSKNIMEIERNAISHANVIIATSKVLKDEIQRLYNTTDSAIQVIYNGVDYDQFNGFVDIGRMKQEYGIGPMDPTILFVGRITTQKGPDLLIEAIPNVLKNHPAAKFLVVGDGDLKLAIEQNIQRLGISHSCRFFGKLQRNDLINLYKICDCVVVPSRNEPFGIAILEAWSAGKPVIVPSNGGSSEFVWHDVTGIKIFPNPDSIAWGINLLFSDFEHARWIGANGRKAVETAFSWETIAEHTLAVYPK